MQMCSKCKKNIAVMFISKVEDGVQKMEGLCLECAKKMGIPVMDNFIKQLGMSEEEFKNLNEQMTSMFENMDEEELNEQMKSMFENVDMNELKDQMKNMFGNMNIDDKNNMFMNMMMPMDTKDIKKDEEDLEEEEINLDIDMEEENEKDKKSKWFKKKRKNLEKYATNLTEKARGGAVDRIIGRNREIDRVVQILNRRTKNNPLLIGEPGVGKTAIAEGLAVRIVEKQVPTKLFNSEIYLLDLTAVVAGTQFRGQFEGRMKSIIDEVREDGNVILVIDEVHNLMGAGEVNGGAMSAANILKPALARGEIQVIGATTLEEYKKHIEKDSALERRFQPIIVEEPSVKESIEILKGIKGYYENYHKVKISDEVIEASVKLSERYITDRYLPDKAIDVIDEAGSRANLKNKGLVELQALKEELKKVQEIREEASNKNDYEKAAEYKTEQCRLESKISTIEKECGNMEITINDIAFVIEAWTKIPVQKITEEEAQKLLNLEERLHRRVIGQDKAIVSLAKTIRRNRSGFRKKKKPASFIFVGPTGVGKTELVKSLAFELFGSEDALIRIDMSEYMEKHSVSKLIGAPPGYVGYDEGGFLTEKVRRKPYSVILLDEIEKAHPDIFNLLLQILEDGRLTDNQGRTTFFENTVIVMTSNAGSHLKSSGIGFSNNSSYDAELKIRETLSDLFRPEFLNRIDDIIVFSHLSKEELYKIIDLMLNEVKEEAKEKNITIEVSAEVKNFILEKGYDNKFGARPLRRTIQRYIEDEIAEAYLQKRFKEGDNIKVEMKEGKVVLSSN